MAPLAALVAGMLLRDLGTSRVSKAPVSDLVLEKLSVSAPLALMGVAVAVLISVPLGVMAGIRHRRPSGAVT